MKIKKLTILTILMMALAMVCMSSQAAHALLTANPDSYTTDEDTPLNVAAPGVLGNDTILNPPGLVLNNQSPSTQGINITVNGDGSFTYNPGATFQYLAQGATINDQFTYNARDLTGPATPATVTITVTGVNDSPPRILL